MKIEGVITLALAMLLTQCVQAKERELDWWEKTIFYQIYPRSFMDTNGDGIGDLNGIISKLEYLKELGVGATWLSPIFQSPMYDFGYDIADYYAIHDEYGTMEDFERLIARAKELDIKIILDFVPNHTSNESVWFEKALEGDSTYYDYFIWEDGVKDENGVIHPPTNWVSVFRKSAWEYKSQTGKYYLHQFVIGQPDLNYRNPGVVEEMKNIIRFWLKKGVAGFRVDAISHLFEVNKELHGGKFPDEPRSGSADQGPDDYGYLNHIYTLNQEETYDMVYQWREVIDEFNKKDGFTRVMMTEGSASIKNIMRYYGEGERLGAQMPFNFGLIGYGMRTATNIKKAIEQWMTHKPLDKTANWVVGNHDTPRVASRYSPELVDGINMIVLLLPGIGVTYMGEEIGMVNGFVSWEDTVDPAGCNTDDPINYVRASRDPERTPFQWSAEKNAGFSTGNKTWLPVAEGYETLNVKVQKAATKSHYHVYRALATLRQDKVSQYGRYETLALNNDVFALRRWYNEKTYVVVINVKNITHTVDLTNFKNVTGSLKVELSSIQSSKQQGDIVEASSVSVAGWEAFVLKNI